MDGHEYLYSKRAIFALGVLLIELCVNKSFQEMRKVYAGSIEDPLLADYVAAERALDEVYSLAGNSYGYATERCVKFAFEGRDAHRDFGMSRFRQQFHDDVVAPVQATHHMYLALRNMYD